MTTGTGLFLLGIMLFLAAYSLGPLLVKQIAWIMR